MKAIGVDASPKQLARLRNGHSVRLKKGKGLILVVHPDRYDLMSRTFQRGKAKEVALTAEELMANRQVSSEAHAELAAKMETESPPIAKKGDLDHPEVIGAGLDPEPPSRVSNAGGPRSIPARSLVGMKQLSSHLAELGRLDGADYGSRIKAGLGNVLQNQLTAEMNEMGIEGRRGNILQQDILGEGIRVRRKEKGSIAVGGNLLSNGTRVLPPALQSQPYGANFQFQHTHPPAYAKVWRQNGPDY